MARPRIYTTSLAGVYPHYVAKAERKGRAKAAKDVRCQAEKGRYEVSSRWPACGDPVTIRYDGPIPASPSSAATRRRLLRNPPAASGGPHARDRRARCSRLPRRMVRLCGFGARRDPGEGRTAQAPRKNAALAH